MTTDKQAGLPGTKIVPSNTAFKYAKALIALDPVTKVPAPRQAESRRHRQEMGQFLALWQENRDLENILRSPMLPIERRVNLLTQIAGHLNLSDKIRNLLTLLLVERKIHLLPGIISAHKVLEMRATGERDVQVFSSEPLTPGQKEELLNTLGEALSSKLNPTFFQDPSLLAGVKVVAGDTVLDGSLSRQLKEIKAHMPTLDWSRDKP